MTFSGRYAGRAFNKYGAAGRVLEGRLARRLRKGSKFRGIFPAARRRFVLLQIAKSVYREDAESQRTPAKNAG